MDTALVMTKVTARYGGNVKIYSTSKNGLVFIIPAWEKAARNIVRDLMDANCTARVYRVLGDEWKLYVNDPKATPSDSKPNVNHAVAALRLELTQLSSDDLKKEVQAGIDLLLRYGSV